MKYLTLCWLLLTSVFAHADETCYTSFLDFRITSSQIIGEGRGIKLQVPYQEARSLSRRSLSDFKALTKELADADKTDEVLSSEEVQLVSRYLITVADGREELISLKYLKGHADTGHLLFRFMMTSEGIFRCR